MKDSDGTGVDATRLNGMAFAPNKPKIGYAVNRQGLWATKDTGRSWQARHEWITIVDDDIYAATQPSGASTSVFGGTL